MSDRRRDAVPAGGDGVPYVPDEWAVFEDSLYPVLRLLEPGDVLQFLAPPDAKGRSARCVIRSGRTTPLWVTSVAVDGNEELVASGDCDDVVSVARKIVANCIESFGVPSPALLTLRAKGAVAAHAHILGLTDDDGVPTGSDPINEDSAVDVAVNIDDPEKLRDRIASIVQQVTGDEPGLDSDDDLFFDHAGCRVYITVAADTPTVTVWSNVVPTVRCRRTAALDIALRNPRQLWTQWVLQSDSVVQRTVINAGPLVPRHVYAELGRFLYVLATRTSDLQLLLAKD